ncbi:MAG: cation:proton antiporter [Dehalococcoidia bacterium]|nr:cation:proton antiporter [Dehalococcoidia bacterium]
MESAALSALAVIGFGLAIANQVAKRLRVPPILLYLILGAVAGQSALQIIRPHELEPLFETALEVLVGLIVFEGAFAIDTDYLRRVGRMIRNLLTMGLVLTWALATLAAGGLGVLPWDTAAIFGALVSVTGPTVIGPLVKRVRLNDRVRAVLIGEGVLIDPLGAMLVVIVLESALDGAIANDPFEFVTTRLGAGLLMGLAGAALVWAVTRINRSMNTTEIQLLLFGASIAVYATSSELLPQSQLMAMATMGLVLAWINVPHAEAVRSFEDDISLLLIGAIYVLAASTVELSVMTSLWPWGFVVVILLMVAIRPAVVFLCSIGSGLRWQERAYVAAIGPRGVVAASLAAFASTRLGEENAGPTLAALVFLTVFMTVSIQSTYADRMADLLGVKAMRAIIGGAGALARRTAQQLEADGLDVLLIDLDEEAVERARAEGLTAEVGDVTDLRFLRSRGALDVKIAVAATDLDHSNLLFTQYLHSVNPEARLFARVSQPGAVEAFRESGASVLSEVDTLAEALAEMIGEPTLTQTLVSRVGDRMTVEVRVGPALAGREIRALGLPPNVLVLLLVRDDGDVIPSGNTVLRAGDRMLLFGTRDLVMQSRERLVTIA